MSEDKSRQRLGSAALMLMTFSAVFAFPSIVNNSIQIGLATIPGYIFGSLFYFLPFILMIAEFASANSDKESGVHSWLESVLGSKFAFLGAWSYFFVNLFFFVSLLPNTLIYGSYALLGHNDLNCDEFCWYCATSNGGYLRCPCLYRCDGDG